jgi:hypothetical protein
VPTSDLHTTRVIRGTSAAFEPRRAAAALGGRYGGWEDKRIKWCVWWQSATMLGYYPLENLAWAGYIAPRLFPVDADKLCQARPRPCGCVWVWVWMCECLRWG